MKKEKKERTIKYKYYDIKTKKMIEKVKTIRSGKEAPSLAGKTASFIALCLLQFTVFVLSYIYLLNSYQWYSIAAQGLSIICCVRVIASDKSPDSKIAWIVFLLIFYYVSFIIYIIWGELSTTPIKRFKLDKIRRETQFSAAKDLSSVELLRVRQECGLIQKSSSFIPYENCAAQYFASGEALFDDILNRLQNAKKFIFIEFFIISDGLLLDKFIKILTEKAAQGVEVKIIYDGLGSNETLSNKSIKALRSAGIKILPFEKFVPVFNLFILYRDHRKIVVIDGEAAYTGGANIADEYINKKVRHGFWKDTGIRVDGDAADSFTLMFLRMWEYLSKEKPQYSDYMKINGTLIKEPDTAKNTLDNVASENNIPKIHAPGLPQSLPALENINAKNDEKIRGKNIVMPYSDGPDDNVLTAKGAYIQMIANAQKYVYIMTPYFIIDDAITELLKNKALSGVDVRIILPGIPDKKTVYAFSRSNAEKLIEYGVRVHIFTPGFLHAKVVLSDDECAIVGSINMDFRSFYQQYECGVYTTLQSAVESVKSDFDDTLLLCEELLSRKKRNPVTRLFLAFLRAFTPLM